MVLSAVNGVGLALVIPNAQSITADYYDELDRGKAFGALYMTSALGGAFGSLYATNQGQRLASLSVMLCVLLALCMPSIKVSSLSLLCWGAFGSVHATKQGQQHVSSSAMLCKSSVTTCNCQDGWVCRLDETMVLSFAGTPVRLESLVQSTSKNLGLKFCLFIVTVKPGACKQPVILEQTYVALLLACLP